MKALETSAAFCLPDPRVVVAGDWHSNAGWARTAIRALGREDRYLRTILHVGDFMSHDWETFCGVIDEECAAAGIERVLVTPGNHDPWGPLVAAFASAPGKAIRVSQVVWFLPRGFVFEIHGRHVLSLGGATSLNRDALQEGITWWEEEALTDDDVSAAIAAGEGIDIMLTHETPENTPVRAVQVLLRSSAGRFLVPALKASRDSRRRVQRVWDAISPELLIHGHMHMDGAGTMTDGRRVVSLHRDTFPGNLALLDLALMEVEVVPHERIRGNVTRS